MIHMKNEDLKTALGEIQEPFKLFDLHAIS